MRLTIDGKSVAVGVFAGVAFVSGLGASQDDSLKAGRYGIAASEQGVFSIDTATREVWQIQLPDRLISGSPVER